MKGYKRWMGILLSVLAIGNYMGTQTIFGVEYKEDSETFEEEVSIEHDESTHREAQEVEELRSMDEETGGMENSVVEDETPDEVVSENPIQEETGTIGNSVVVDDAQSEAESGPLTNEIVGEEINKEGSSVLEEVDRANHYYDWDNVPKITLSHQNLSEVAAVWEGDLIYLYVKEKNVIGNAHSFTWNTYFEWTSDYGMPISFRAYVSDWNNPIYLDIQGYEGAEGIGTLIGDTYCWEMKFPTSVLGEHIKDVSLRWYGSADSILDLTSPIAELYPHIEDEPGQGSITIDGYFEEWDYIPHGRLTYKAGNGTCEHSGALYIENGILYGHLKMDNQYGEQMPLNAMYIYVNGQQVQFSAHYKNADQSINWEMDQQIYDMPEGTSQGVSIFYAGYPPCCLGDAVIRVNDAFSHSEGDEYEFAISLELLSKVTGIPVESMSQFELIAPNIGTGSICVYGTSTAPLLGFLLCVISVGGCMIYRKRRKIA